MDQKKAYKHLIRTAENILSEIRLAIKEGKSQTAVSLAAQRYQLLKQLEELKCSHFFQSDPPFNSIRTTDTSISGYFVPQA